MSSNTRCSYDQAAEEYVAFYGADLYSVHEDRAIASVIGEFAGDVLSRERLRVCDVGCGAGLPRAVWRQVLGNRTPETFRYEGADLSPGMIEMANEVYHAEVEAGLTSFRVANALELAPGLPDDAYDLMLTLHGVLAHVYPGDLTELLRHIGRATRGCAVLSFFSRHADCRAPEYPAKTMYECRQMGGEPIVIHTYTLDEIEEMLDRAGLKPRVLQGVSVRGGHDEVHGNFVERQAQLEVRQKQGEAVDAEFAALEETISAVIEDDLRIGRAAPERAHDIVVIAET